MICISKHNLMPLASLLLQICSNYVHYGMYEIGDCLYPIAMALFYDSSFPSSRLILFHRGISYTDIFCPQIYSINNQLYHVFNMYADEM